MKKQKIRLGLTALLLCIWGYAWPGIKAVKHNAEPVIDTAVSAEIQAQLNSPKDLVGLYYPQSVTRYYKQKNFGPIWIKPQTSTGKTWEAMLMIDCVLQFGLSHDDYHPAELLYDQLHQMLDKPGTVSAARKARFDVMLTDAMLALINHLHYGKLNPRFPDVKIDGGKTIFHAEDVLAAALLRKDLMNEVVKVQPQIKEYQDLQNYMRLTKGQYLDDCYEVPEATVRLAAINMERLRWADITEAEYIHVNIPSYTLKLHLPDTTYRFKIKVGSPLSPTPTLQSAVKYVTVNASQSIVFGLSEPAGVYLQSIAAGQLGAKNSTSNFSNGPVGIAHAEKLASLLLKNNSAGNRLYTLNKTNTQTFILRKPVTVVITYLTCEIKDGALVSYDDIYKLDKNLEMGVYNLKEPLTMR